MLDPQTQDALHFSLLAPSYTITNFRALFRYHGYRKKAFYQNACLPG